MRKLGVVEDTLFVPMLGRIHASEHCPQIFCIKLDMNFDYLFRSSYMPV